MNRFRRAIFWILLSAINWWLIYRALWTDAKWAGNIIIAMTWFGATINVMSLLVRESVRLRRNNGRSIWQPIAIISEIAQVIVLVAFGWWFTAIGTFISLAAEYFIYNGENIESNNDNREKDEPVINKDSESNKVVAQEEKGPRFIDIWEE